MTTSTESRLSRPRSSVKEASAVSCKMRSSILLHDIHFGVVHLLCVDLLKALQHVQHSGSDFLLREASSGRESCTLEQPCPPWNGSSGDRNTTSRKAGGRTTECDTEERHFKGGVCDEEVAWVSEARLIRLGERRHVMSRVTSRVRIIEVAGIRRRRCTFGSHVGGKPLLYLSSHSLVLRFTTSSR